MSTATSTSTSSTRTRKAAARVLAAAAAVLAKGYRPVIIYPAGFPRARGGPATGKEPFGPKWGLKPVTPESLARDVEYFASRGYVPGLGLCLGPGCAPGGGWLVDVEGDGPEAEASRIKLFDGEDVETIGHKSTRGGHRFYRGDGERLKAIAARLKPFQVKTANQPGVFHLPTLPDLEQRLGGWAAEGVVKQLQSVIPPTPGTDGAPRTWGPGKTLADLPESFYATLEAIADEAEAGPTNGEEGVAQRPAATDRPGQWLANALRNAAGRVAMAPAGNRHPTLLAEARTLAGYLHYSLGFTEEELAATMTEAANRAAPERVDDNARTVRDAIGFGRDAPLTLPDELHRLAIGAKPSGNGKHRGPPPIVTEAPPRRLPRFSNCRQRGKAGDPNNPPKLIGLTMAELAADLFELTGGWPKRVGPMLFVEGADHKPQWLDAPEKLFAWIDRQARVRWTKGSSFITQKRFYEDLRVNAEPFDAIEVCPHFPPMPRTYYMHEPVGQPGGKLEGLLDFFRPATPTDRHLLKAFVLTLLWGGHPGRRPSFLITGPDVDATEKGRGVGKSTVGEIIPQELVEGFIEVPITSDMENVKTRLLSPGAAYTRVARLDNVKKLRFSWAELESLMTTSVISGKRLYQGEGRRVNTLLWVITINGASLSEDLAQRSIHIKLNRPAYYSPTWEAEVRQYIRENRAALWADVREALDNRDRTAESSGRWAEWECGVLAATPDVVDTQIELAARREAVNADRSEADDFRHYVVGRLTSFGYKPDDCYVFIHSAVMSEWLDRVERKRHATKQVKGLVTGFGIPELTYDRKNTNRGWLWKGSNHEGRGKPVERDEIDWDRAFPGLPG